MKKSAFVVLFLVLCAGGSFAAKGNSSKNFALGYSKLDVGINNVTLDQIAGRYWFTNTLGMDVTLGFKGGDNQSMFLVGGKFLSKIISVKSLDIYLLAGFNFGNYDPKIPGQNSFSIFRLQGGLGAEYYILPCLSVLTELSMSYQSASANGTSVNDFGILADWLPQAGVRFYF